MEKGPLMKMKSWFKNLSIDENMVSVALKVLLLVSFFLWPCLFFIFLLFGDSPNTLWLNLLELLELLIIMIILKMSMPNKISTNKGGRGRFIILKIFRYLMIGLCFLAIYATTTISLSFVKIEVARKYDKKIFPQGRSWAGGSIPHLETDVENFRNAFIEGEASIAIDQLTSFDWDVVCMFKPYQLYERHYPKYSGTLADYPKLTVDAYHVNEPAMRYYTDFLNFGANGFVFFDKAKRHFVFGAETKTRITSNFKFSSECLAREDFLSQTRRK